MKVTGKAAQAAVFERVRATPFTRIPGKLTRRDYILLKNEAAEGACAIESGYEWSGEFGHLPLVIGAAEYLRITTDNGTPLTYLPETQPQAFNPAITANSSEYQARKKTAEWEEKRECWYALCGTNEGLCHNMRDAIDEMYYKQLKRPIIGYRGLKIKDYLDHLETKWCKLTTSNIKEMKANYYQKWSQELHITDFGKYLDDEQIELGKAGVIISEDDKLQHYTEQMYDSHQFTRKMMILWENKPTADKTWTNATSYFEGETEKIETFQANSTRSASESKYESAAKMDESEANTGDQLREYLDSLKAADAAQKQEYAQQMSSSTETIAEMNTKFEAKISAKDEQIAMLFKQNEAILRTLTRLSQTSNDEEKEDPPPKKRGQRKRREKCGHGCGGWHPDDACWELPANASKRPANWKSRLATPLK